eukprot:8721569-Pyramimonas_sp.AAC.1
MTTMMMMRRRRRRRSMMRVARRTCRSSRGRPSSSTRAPGRRSCAVLVWATPLAWSCSCWRSLATKASGRPTGSSRRC